MEIKLTNTRAHIHLPLHVIAIGNEGFRCSERALVKINNFDREVYSTYINGEIAFVSTEEFNENGLKEIPIKPLNFDEYNN